MESENIVYDLSLVIPVYNEVENLRPLVEEIAAALDGQPLTYEVIFVDDGSSDHSFDLVQELNRAYPQIGGIRFRQKM
jgi:glycosyltransferase involved in cell wall biosynthesis